MIQPSARRLSTLLLVALAVAAACGERPTGVPVDTTIVEPPPPPPPPPTPLPVGAIALAPADTTVDAGASLQLRMSGSAAGLTWKSQDERIATVDATGRVVTKSVGTVSIIVSNGDSTAPSRGVATVRVLGPVGREDAPTRLSVGAAHTCAIAADGAAWCWGDNEYGQLGDGTTEARIDAVRVAGGIQFVEIAAGYRRSCGLTGDGRTFCWGAPMGEPNLFAPKVVVPRLVENAPAFARLSMHGAVACGITPNGDAWCWGVDTGGAIGDGSSGSRTTPVKVAGSTRFRSIAAGTGSSHSCGIAEDGAAWCWGNNGVGALGDGTTSSSLVPVRVAGDLTFAAIAVSSLFTCALTTTGQVHCWGANGLLQFGPSHQTIQATPRRISESQFSALSAGAGGAQFGIVASDALCALRADGTAQCWRDDGSTSGAVVTAGSTRFTAIAVGGGMCGIQADAIVYCPGRIVPKVMSLAAGIGGRITRTEVFGPASHVVEGGTLGLWVDVRGDGWTSLTGRLTQWRSSDPTVAAVDPLTGVVRGIRAGGPVTITAHTEDKVASTQVLVAPAGPLEFTQVRGDGVHMCGRTPAANFYCWGTQSDASFHRPKAMYVGSGFTQVTQGYRHGCAIDGSGRASCWGYNSHGQLGVGYTATGQARGVEPVAGNARYVSLVSGVLHTCGLTAAGEVHCWGDAYTSYSGGSGGSGWVFDHNGRWVPTLVSAGLTFKAISASTQSAHTCGLVTTGEAYCWGSVEGLGRGADFGYPRRGVPLPVPVAGGRRYTSISAGSNGACAIAEDGVTWCWAFNEPAAVPTAERFTAVSVSHHRCGLTAAGQALCWGFPMHVSQLGRGDGVTVTSFSVPEPVVGGLTFESITAGVDVTCGLTRGERRAYCWGRTGVGDGTAAARAAPVAVVGAGP